jgi:glycosyltransferase involved in cell wall biosynthesis
MQFAIRIGPGAGFFGIMFETRAAKSPWIGRRLRGRSTRMSESNSNAPDISVVVPVKNEAGNIAPLVAEIAAALAGRRFEVIYVNDGSTDATEAELRGLQGQYPWLRQIRHATSCGQTAALRSGMIAARAPVIVTLDGDGENDPAFLPVLIGALAQGGHRIGLVAGQRVGRKASAFKKLQSRIAAVMRGAILHDGTRDSGCGLKAFPRELGLKLPYFDGLHRFLPALVRREGFDVGYIDVIDRPRRHGVSNYGMWDRLWIGILDLAGVWWLIHRRKRVPEISEI